MATETELLRQRGALEIAAFDDAPDPAPSILFRFDPLRSPGTSADLCHPCRRCENRSDDMTAIRLPLPRQQRNLRQTARALRRAHG